MNTVVNGGAIVEECLLNSNGGRDLSLSAINGSINFNEDSASPPLYVETRILYNCHSKVHHSKTFHTLGDLRAKSFKARFYLETDF